MTSVDNTNGTWQYSLGGNKWVDFGTIGANSAVLLSDRNRIRFVPNAGFVGTASILYKAWDRTAGQVGDRGVDTTGLLNSFSVFEETAAIEVAD